MNLQIKLRKVTLKVNNKFNYELNIRLLYKPYV